MEKTIRPDLKKIENKLDKLVEASAQKPKKPIGLQDLMFKVEEVL